MAFVINKIKGSHVDLIAGAIQRRLEHSRFTAIIVTHKSKVTIHEIRLRKSKDYCGNHPNACPIRPGVHKPHKHHKYLEGADWVAFNDMLNDVLDALGCEANAGSSLCIIRKGVNRRAEYHGHFLGNNIDREWNKDSHVYVNNTGGNPLRSEYPLDTPGLAEWKI